MSVMKGVNPEFELIRMPDIGFQIGNCVAMSVDTDLSPKHSTQALPLAIRSEMLIHVLCTNPLSSVAPFVLFVDIVPGVLERIPELPRLTKSTERSSADLAIHILWVLTAGHL